jgi:hypothetical protein
MVLWLLDLDHLDNKEMSDFPRIIGDLFTSFSQKILHSLVTYLFRTKML